MKVIYHSKRKLLTAIIVALFASVVTAAPQPDTEQEIVQDSTDLEQSQRDDKVFIALIKIPPDQCTTNDNTNTLGTCMPSSECTKRGGSPSGTCAKGLGTCCLVKRSCNTQTSLNNTYFVNPDLSTTSGTGACVLTVNRATTNICQIRLDFTRLQLSQPDNNGICNKDFLTVTGGGVSGLPMICGDNNGQHMYINVEPNGGAIRITVDRTIATTIASRNWNIQVTQIACDSKDRAPADCLQYYTETSGRVQSFNYLGTSSTTVPTSTRQLANQNYAVCIKKASGYCGITWGRDPTSTYSFTVSSDVSAVAPDLIGTPAASSTGADRCQNDYVIIPEGIDDTKAQADRYCGLGFPNNVTSTAMPFMLYVKTDSNETTDGGNQGFSLLYRQTSNC